MSNVVKFPKHQTNKEAFLLEAKQLTNEIKRLQQRQNLALVIGLAVVAGWMVGTLAAQI